MADKRAPGRSLDECEYYGTAGSSAIIRFCLPILTNM